MIAEITTTFFSFNLIFIRNMEKSRRIGAMRPKLFEPSKVSSEWVDAKSSLEAKQAGKRKEKCDGTTRREYIQAQGRSLRRAICNWKETK